MTVRAPGRHALPHRPLLAQLRAPPLAAVLVSVLAGAACVDAGDVASIDGPAAEVGDGAAGRVPLVRPDSVDGGLQFDFEEDDVVESHASPGGRFRVHFTRDGINAVPAADDDASGVPDFVEEVATTYDAVLAAYGALGLRAPLGDGDFDDNGGDDRFDVYLVDFAGVGDGAYRDDRCLEGSPDRCAGFMTQENDYAGYGYSSTTLANRILASHEFFHAVQSAYDNDQGSVLSEGTAVWATERFDPSLRDLEAFADGYLQNPDRPIDEPLPGPVDPFSYGSGIFFQFLDERFGVEVLRALLEATEDGAGGIEDPYWLDRLDPVLASEGSSFADAFSDFARWNLYTDDFADPAEAYARGDGFPRVRIDPVALPLAEERLRLYRASAQYLDAAPGDRGSITAAVVPTALAPDGADGVRVLLAVEADGAVAEVITLDDPTAGTQVIDAAVADRVIAVVINTTTAGDSRKPGLCLGTVDEVASCKEVLGAVEPTGTGTGGGGGAAPSDTTASGGGALPGEGGGGGSVDDAGEGPADDGCGCAVPGGQPSDVAGRHSTPVDGRLAVALGLLAAYARRRRRAATPSPIAAASA